MYTRAVSLSADDLRKRLLSDHRHRYHEAASYLRCNRVDTVTGSERAQMNLNSCLCSLTGRSSTEPVHGSRDNHPQPALSPACHSRACHSRAQPADTPPYNTVAPGRASSMHGPRTHHTPSSNRAASTWCPRTHEAEGRVRSPAYINHVTSAHPLVTVVLVLVLKPASSGHYNRAADAAEPILLGSLVSSD